MQNRPKIVAILNVTEDSFSDGGRYLDPDAALKHGRALTAAGADILEIGPASSNPDARSVSAAEQIERLRPVLKDLGHSDCNQDGHDRDRGAKIPISIDATEPEVLRFAMEHRVAFLNDVRGFPDPSFQEELAHSQAALIVMHSLAEGDRATREDASPQEVLDSIERFFEKRLAELVSAGVKEERLVVDPGMGFFLGRNPDASVEVLRRIPALRERFGCPVFISVSRKSFLRAITGRATSEIGPATLAAELYAARKGVDYLRTHDVAALSDALKLTEALDDAPAT